MSDASNSILIRHIAPRNFLSFGPDNAGIELQSLNLFIGPNGSGKSNLIEAISLMRSAPKDFRDVTRKGGGVAEWIWKGGANQPASVDWVVESPNGQKPLRHVMAFHAVAQAFSLDDERVEETGPRHLSESDVCLLLSLSSGAPGGEYESRRQAKSGPRHDRSRPLDPRPAARPRNLSRTVLAGPKLREGPHLPRMGFRAECGFS